MHERMSATMALEIIENHEQSCFSDVYNHGNPLYRRQKSRFGKVATNNEISCGILYYNVVKRGYLLY